MVGPLSLYKPSKGTIKGQITSAVVAFLAAVQAPRPVARGLRISHDVPRPQGPVLAADMDRQRAYQSLPNRLLRNTRLLGT